MSSALSTLNTTTEVPLSKAPNPQLLPGRRSINGCPLLRVCVHGVCVFTAVCVCTLDGLNAEHEFRVWVTILSRMSRHFHFFNGKLIYSASQNLNLKKLTLITGFVVQSHICYVLTTPPTTIMPIDVREVSDANPVTMETISSSWVKDPWGKGGILVLTGVMARGLGTWQHKTHIWSVKTQHRKQGPIISTTWKTQTESWNLNLHLQYKVERHRIWQILDE